MSMRVYFARPISGCTYDEVVEYYKEMVDRFAKYSGVVIYHPMVGKKEMRCDAEFRSHGYSQVPCSTNHAILQRDLWMVAQADLVFVNLVNTTEISIGCCMELAVAHWLRKHTIVCLQKDNIHEHAFTLEAADVIFRNEVDAIIYIEKLIKSQRGEILL